MAPQTTAMLFALTSPHPSLSLHDFNKWYDTRHAPSRAECPGVHSVSRFQLVEDAEGTQRVGSWTWLAMYELESEGALQTPEYQKAREEDGDDESRMFDFLSRRVYTLLDDKKREDFAAFAATGKSRLMSIIGLPSEVSKELNNSESANITVRESTTSISSEQGWLRTSFWRLSTAADPRTWEAQTDVPPLLVLSEFEDTSEARGSVAFARGWGSLLQTAVENGSQPHETALLTLWKQF